MSALMKLENVFSNIGQYQILQGVSFEVPKNRLTVLLGRNGAGKSTTLKTVMGYYPLQRGIILLHGKPMRRPKPYQMSRYGIGYMPEEGHIFGNLSVAENLLISDRKKDGKHKERVEQVSEIFPDLRAAYQRKAGTLSGGQRQMLGIASLLVSEPEVLMIDEPSKGLSPAFVDILVDTLLKLKQGKTILLVEQNFYLASKVADGFCIIDGGRTVLSGEMSELIAREEWQTQYLGVAAAGGVHGWTFSSP